MPLRPRRPAASFARHARGAILIESLAALAVLSLGAAGMLQALDHLEATGRAAKRLNADARAYTAQTETR